MATYMGSSLVLSWKTSTGTTALQGDYRTFTINDNVDLVDATAGADADKTYLPGAKDGQASLTYLHQSGTADIQQLKAGQIGTLEVSPEGTAATKPKYSYPMIVNPGASWNIPYAGAVEISVGFQKNGARTDGTN
jgi:hypothetical protein